MEITNNHILFEKLKRFFEQNIRLSFVSKLSIIIVTYSDECFEFRRNHFTDRIKNSLIALSDNEAKVKALIGESFIQNLSYKKLIDFKNGERHLIARTIDGKVYSWGENGKGMLGNGMKDLRTFKPEMNQFLINENIIDMSCGCDHTLVLTDNGDVYAWGGNTFGQIGNRKSGSDECQISPFKLNAFNGEKIKAISCGPYHSMALTKSGRVYSWGKNYCGQLGIGDEMESNAPKLVELSRNFFIDKICCGHEHNLFLSDDGDIYVCGWNRYGELGISDCENTSIPIKLKISEKFVDIASYFNRSISAAVTVNCIYYIWGDCGASIIIEPKETELKSFNDIFEYCFQISLEPVKGKLIQFNEDFVENNNYVNKFIEKKRIGSGSYGKVFEVRGKFYENMKYAVKKIKFDAMYKKVFMKVLETSPIIYELSHDNIVKYLNVWLENDYIYTNGIKTYNYILYIQMELCDKSLNKVIDEIKSVFNLYSNETLTSFGYFIASKLFIELLEGVSFLHKHKPPIIHRNLSPWNIMLKIEEQSKLFVKITGFTLATFHEYLNQSHTKDIGNPRYMAPEVLMSNKYDTRADIYSLGVISQELFFIDVNRDYNNSEVEPPLINKYQEISELCDKMTRPRVNQRPSNVDEVLRDKNSWALNKNEFKYEEDLKKLCNLTENNESFVLKSLKKGYFKD